MQRKMKPISTLSEGMVLGEDIVTKNGVIVLQQGISLTNELIEKIKSFHHSENVYVFQKEDKQQDMSEKFKNLIKDYEEEQKSIERRKKKRKFYAGQIEMLANKLKESIFIEEAQSKVFNRELNHIIFDIKKLTTDCYNIFSVILSEGNVENYLYEHTIKSALVSCMLGKWMKVEADDLNVIIKGSLLKDIGKIRIQKEILEKTEKLLPQEFKEIKKHPLYSYAIIKDIEKVDRKVCEIVLQHHEREDGSGYPLGIKGEEINMLSKIVSIGDIFAAMISNRVYAKKLSPFKVLTEFQQDAFDKLHMGVVMTFIKNFSEYYINAKVKLSNGENGRIIRLDMSEISKPLIKTSKGEFVDLKNKRDIEITDILDKLF